MSEVPFNKDNDLLPRVAVIGGGTGTFTVVSGLSPRFGERVTSIVNMVDDGGSTGELRDQYGTLPPGDTRQSLVAMTPPGELSLFMRSLLNYRFSEGASGNSGLKGQSLGNLLIMAAAEICEGDITDGLRHMGMLFNHKGRVIPVTREDRRLVIKTPDGDEIHGEHFAEATEIASLKGSEIRFDKEPTVINPEAEAAIREADIAVIAPGDFYTSIAPTLAVQGMKEALSAATTVVQFTNLMNRPRHTRGFTVADFAEETERVLGGNVLDYVVYNTERPDQATLDRYAGEGAFFVDFDPVELDAAHYKAIGRHLLSKQSVEIDPNDDLRSTRSLVRHDPLGVAMAILRIHTSGDHD